MALLLTGILMWSLLHLLPSAGRPLRQQLINKFGEKIYKPVFALLILGTVVLMVFGWRSTTPTFLYSLPDGSQPIALGLMVVAYALMGAAMYPTVIKHYVRHPQLSGTIIWAIAHLMLNGDSRSVMLFGGIGIWAIIAIYFINRREGEWKKPAPASARQNAIGAAISLAVFVVTILLHPYLSGVSLL